MLMNLAELSQATGLSRSTLSRLRTEGMPYTEGVGTRRYDLEEVKAFITKMKAKGTGLVMTEGTEYSNGDIISYFKVGMKGRIRKSNTRNALVLISDAEDPAADHLSRDFFDSEGLLHFGGQRMEDGQELTKGETALKESCAKSIVLYLFMKHGKDRYIYRGIAVNADDIYTEHLPDHSFRMRFPLELRSADSLNACLENYKHIQEAFGKTAMDMDLRSLYEINEMIVQRNDLNPELAKLSKAVYDPAVEAYVIRRAEADGGYCQLCGSRTDLYDVTKPPRLICCHYEHPLLGKEERDDKSHTAALCDNCNARIHKEGLFEKTRYVYASMFSFRIKKSEEKVRRMINI